MSELRVPADGEEDVVVVLCSMYPPVGQPYHINGQI